MTRLLKAEILSPCAVPGHVQVELTFESPAVPRGDWSALAAAMRAGDIPMRSRKEVRTYATAELAQMAIDRLDRDQRGMGD